MKAVETKTLLPGESVRELIDFNDVLQQALNSLTFMEGFNSVRIRSQITVTQEFYNDRILIAPVVQHLIGNAIRYRREDPNAFVKIQMEDFENGVNITVSDNGIGIAGNIQENITKMFSRVTDKIPGHGLGLYTIHHCVRKLYGHIALESKEDTGTTFKVFVPNEGRPAW